MAYHPRDVGAFNGGAAALPHPLSWNIGQFCQNIRNFANGIASENSLVYYSNENSRSQSPERMESNYDERKVPEKRNY